MPDFTTLMLLGGASLALVAAAGLTGLIAASEIGFTVSNYPAPNKGGGADRETRGPAACPQAVAWRRRA